MEPFAMLRMILGVIFLGLSVLFAFGYRDVRRYGPDHFGIATGICSFLVMICLALGLLLFLPEAVPLLANLHITWGAK